VLVQPVGEAALEAGAAVAELGELDQVLELEVVDVIDQPVAEGTRGIGGRCRPSLPLMSTRMLDFMTGAWELLRHEPTERRVRASLDGRTIVDSRRALLLWEPRRICPSYAVPDEDIRAELGPAVAPSNGDAPPVLHPGIPFSVHSAPGEPLTVAGREGAGFRFDDPDLAGYVALDFDAFEWREEDEPIKGHPRDPYHRVDVRRSERPVRIEVGGEVVAETTRAGLLCETNLPMRFYLPREDVRVPLEPSSFRSHCPYKGDAVYFSVEAGGQRLEDVAWSYEHPYPGLQAVAGYVAFWDHRVDVFLDGSLRQPPGGALSEAMHDEFSV
jgi:uncharacterized protein (DUF427 family)